MPFNSNATWREDGEFTEMSCYVNTPHLNGFGSEYNLIGVGGRIKDRSCDINEKNVLVYFQELNDGSEFELNITPESALKLADLLQKWAYDAENSNFDVNVKMERLRKSYYTQDAKRIAKRIASRKD